MEILNLTFLQSFLEVVKTRSFQEAANTLAIAQPTVTQHIQKIEEQLGVLLFQRSRTGCTPTPQAQSLLPYAESMLRLNQRALAAMRGGHVRVGASSNIGIYLLQPYLKSFLQGCEPGHFDLMIDRNPIVAEQLEIGELDIAVMEWWDERPGFCASIWKREPVVLIVPPEHAWAERTGVGKQELQRVELLGGESGTGTGRLLLNYFGSAESVPRVSFQLGSTEAVKQAVKAGLGISMVLESAVSEEVRNGSLAAIPLSQPGQQGLYKELWVIWRNGGRGVRQPDFVRHLLA